MEVYHMAWCLLPTPLMHSKGKGNLESRKCKSKGKETSHIIPYPGHKDYLQVNMAEHFPPLQKYFGMKLKV